MLVVIWWEHSWGYDYQIAPRNSTFFGGSVGATKSTLRKKVWWNTGSWVTDVTVHFCTFVTLPLEALGRCGPILSLRRFRESWGHRWTWLSQSPAGCSAGGPRFPRLRLEAGWASQTTQCTAARQFPQESSLHIAAPSPDYKRSLAMLPSFSARACTIPGPLGSGKLHV